MSEAISISIDMANAAMILTQLSHHSDHSDHSEDSEMESEVVVAGPLSLPPPPPPPPPTAARPIPNPIPNPTMEQVLSHPMGCLGKFIPISPYSGKVLNDTQWKIVMRYLVSHFIAGHFHPTTGEHMTVGLPTMTDRTAELVSAVPHRMKQIYGAELVHYIYQIHYPYWARLALQVQATLNNSWRGNSHMGNCLNAHPGHLFAANSNTIVRINKQHTSLAHSLNASLKGDPCINPPKRSTFVYIKVDNVDYVIRNDLSKYTYKFSGRALDYNPPQPVSFVMHVHSNARSLCHLIAPDNLFEKNWDLVAFYLDSCGACCPAIPVPARVIQ